MIPAVNLLPWRDRQRRRRNQVFGLQLGGALAAALALIGSFALHLNAVADGQRQRNDFLQERIAQFDRRIEEVERLRHQQRELSVRIEAIQALAARRGAFARLLEGFVSTLPAGVYYQAMDLRGDLLTLRGVASSNQEVSALMRNLQEHVWFAEPRLLNLKDAMLGGLSGGSATNGPGSAINGQGSAFSMTVLRAPLSPVRQSALNSAVAAASTSGH